MENDLSGLHHTTDGHRNLLSAAECAKIVTAKRLMVKEKVIHRRYLTVEALFICARDHSTCTLPISPIGKKKHKNKDVE
ncbi:MAG TPA: hypothetical protein VGN34_09540 [Ktedonobacteraceae bacterium]|jgi:hypothetical protein